MRELGQKEWIAIAVSVTVVFVLIIFPSFNISSQALLFGDENITAFQGGVAVKELRVETLREGVGEGAEAGDTLVIEYIGRLLNGEVFDTTRDSGMPFEFELGRGTVISGFDSGLIGMKEGEIRVLLIPPHEGYGEIKRGPIPPNSTLIFEVELKEIR